MLCIVVLAAELYTTNYSDLKGFTFDLYLSLYSNVKKDVHFNLIHKNS